MLYSHVESQEMYLKVIARLGRIKHHVRAIDISEDTGYARSSVSVALSILERDGYIKRISHGIIEFTERGQEEVDFLEDRYLILKKILMNHGLSKEESEKTACEIEHYINRDIYQKLKKNLETK